MEEFTIYGDEWKKKMNKWTKTRLIEMCAKIGKQNEQLEAEVKEQKKHNLYQANLAMPANCRGW